MNALGSNLSSLNLNIDPLTPWTELYSGHTQTLLAHFMPTPDFIGQYEVYYLSLPDGDQCTLKIYQNAKSNIVLTLYHGLAGDHRSDYIQRSAKWAFELGWTVILVDHRGAGLSKGKAQFPYHSGRGEDVSAILEYLKKRFPKQRQVACGFSMSGSILLNLVSGRRGTVLPDYAIVVNAPINLGRASTLLTKGFSKIYDLRFYYKLRQDLKTYYQQKLPLFGHTQNVDDLFTSVKSGYKNKEDYYEQCSTYNYIENITCPTFVLTSMDDPFVDFMDYKNLSWPKNVHVTYSKFGGHMGYYSNKIIKFNNINFEYRWLDYYLHSVFKTIENVLCTDSADKADQAIDSF